MKRKRGQLGTGERNTTEAIEFVKPHRQIACLGIDIYELKEGSKKVFSTE